MKRSVLVILIGLFAFASLCAQVQHRLTGPRAKNAKYWKTDKRSYKPVASLNGMTMTGRSVPPLIRKSKLRQSAPVKPRLTGPRAKNNGPEKKKSRSFNEAAVATNGRKMTGRSTPSRFRKIQPEQSARKNQRLTGPRAKNTPHHLRKKKYH